MDFQSNDLRSGNDIENEADTQASTVSAGNRRVVAEPGDQNTLILPAGVSLDDIRIDGRNLLIDLPDGTVMVVVDGAVFIPQIVIDGISVPPMNLAALLDDDNIEPAAGAPQSSGGNFVEAVDPLADAYGLGDLLPYTELSFPTQTREEIFPTLNNEIPEISIVTPDQPAGAIDATSSVSEAGLPARGEESAGSDAASDSETTGGMMLFVANDGPSTMTMNGIVVSEVGQVFVTEYGTLTITSIAPGAIGYSYTLNDNVGGEDVRDIFTVVVTDADGDTATGTLTVSVLDDVPTALDDTDFVAAGTYGPETGNVISGEGTTSGDSGIDVAGADGASLTSVSGAGGETASFVNGVLTMAGEYGVLTIAADGSYSYLRNPDTGGGVSDSFTYTLTDGDGDTSSATLTVSIGDSAPAIISVPENGDGTIVDEDGLPARGDEPEGTQAETDDEQTTGTITFVSPDGIADILINGESVVVGKPITVGNGTLVVTDLDLVNGTLTYTYTLNDNTSGDDTSVSFDITIIDLDGDTATDTVTIDIIDDAPIARDDSALQGAENAAITIDAFANDTPGADDVAFDAIAMVDGTLSGGGSVAYNGDGSFTYTPAPGEEGIVTFDYTITDGDGDVSRATVTITLLPDSTPTILVAEGSDTVVDEAALSFGTDPASSEETAAGTLVITTGNDTVASLVVGGVDVTNGGTVTGTYGTLTVTGSPSAGYSYSYTLTAASEDVAGAEQDVFAITVTDSDGDPASTSLAIDIIDDTPLALPDTDSVPAGSYVAITGNVIANDTPGADGFGGVVAIASDATLAGDTSFDAGVLVVTGQYGTLTIEADGDYSYARAAGTPGGVSESFTYSYKDGDGDVISSTLTIDIGDALPVVVSANNEIVALDDDVFGGNPGGVGDNSPDTANLTGTLDAAGGDGPLTFALNGTTLPAGFTTSIATDGSLLVQQDGTTVLTITLDASGNYTVTQNAPIDHPAGGAENDLVFTIGYDVTDVDGDKASGSFTVVVDDDTPVIAGNAQFAGMLGVDETSLAIDASGDFAGAFTVSFGADGAGSLAYALVLTSEGADSGLDATAGGSIFLFTAADGSIEGRVGGATGAIAFTVAVDASGTVVLDQRLALDHPVTSDPDDVLALTGGVLSLNATATDGDGDSASQSLDLGGRLRFADDGPAIVLTGTELPSLTVDETNLAIDADGIGFAGAFAIDYGTDGAGSVAYALTITAGTDSGLVDTATGESIYLYYGANGVVEGRVGSETGAIAFTVTADGSGNVSLDQVRALVHPDAPDNYDEAISPVAGTVVLTATVTDGDGDSASQALDISGRLIFQDDGPVANDDGLLQVAEDTALTFNVLANDDAGTDGLADLAVTSGPASGTLTYNGNGSFTYTPDAGAEGPDSFTYTITDGDGDTATATVTLNIAPDSTPTILVAEGSDTVVDEAALSFGTDPASNEETAAGTLVITTGNDTVATLVVGGVDVTSGGTVTGTYGTLTVTGSPSAGYSYSYTLTAASEDVAGAEQDVFAITVTDSDGDPASTSLAIDIIDDTPLALPDTDSVPAGSYVAITGNVIANDTPGADGFGGVVAIASDATLAGDTSFDAGVLVVTGQYGTLTIEADGDYSYARAAGTPGGVSESFTYSYKDGDGDVISSTLTIDIGDALPVVVSANNEIVALDDDVFGGNPGGVGDNSPDTANLTGTLDAAGGDGPLTFALNGTTLPAGFTTSIATDGSLLVQQDGTTVLTITLDASGNYTVTQNAPIDHPAGGAENDLVFTIGYDVTDVDGDKASGSFTVVVDDDTPVIAGNAQFAGMLGVDETSLAIDASGDFAGAFTVSFGADGAGSLAYALVLTSEGADSGLDATAGGSIFLFTAADGSIEGRVGGATGAIAFTVAVDASGTVVLDQRLALDHPVTSDPDDVLALTGGVLSLNATATDGDGDSASQSLDLGGRLRFADDGPAIVLTGTELPSLTVDETNLAIDADGIGFAGAFAIDYGTDGAGSVAYALTITAGTDSGLVDTATGESIYLYYGANGVVEGRVGSETGAIAFTVTADGSGNVSLDQVRALVHPDAPDNYDEAISPVAGTVVLTATVTDGDGDSASQALDISGRLIFQDDGPVANDDGLLQVAEDTALTFNVLANDDAGTDGLADLAVTSGPASGTLTYNGNGSFTYTPDAGAEGPDSFTYTITDGDGDTATATVTLNIAPDSTPTILVAEGSDTVVDEAALSFGTDPASNEETAAGTLVITTGNDTVATLVVGGVDVTNGGTVTGTYGTLTVTGSPSAGYSYSYTLTAASEDVAGAEQDVFAITVTDSDGDPASTSLAIDIIDDTPLALPDTDSVPAGSYVAITGNVIANDTPGADGFGGVVAIASDATLAGDTSFDAGVLVVTGQYGTLTIEADGDYSYARAAGTPGGVSESFTYSYKDGDGDVVSSTLTIDIGDALPVVVSANNEIVALDDDVFGGNPGGVGDNDPDTANLTGTLDAAGGDGPLTFALNGTTLPAGFTTSIATDGSLLVQQDGTTVLTITLDASGNYTVTQNAPIDHPAGGAENDLVFTIGYDVTDVDGDKASGSFTVVVDDDTPVIAGNAQFAGMLSVDETNLANDASGDFASAFTVSFGADGAGSLAYALVLTSEGADSGLDATAGGSIFLFTAADGSIEGRVGGATGAIAFTVAVDASGTVVLDQRLALDHPVTSDPDDVLALAGGVLSLNATATDGDGDSASQSLDLGGRLRFADDGPAIVLTGTGLPSLTVDETNLAVDADGIGFAGAFAIDYGTDGAGLVAYALTITASTDSGLVDTATGESIYLYYGANGVVEGRVGSETGAIAFTVTADGSGNVSLDQVRALVHPDAPDNYDEAISPVAGTVVLTATVTDGDGDSASQALDISGRLIFQDDGPVANDDGLLQVAEDTALTFNVLANDDAGTDGLADLAVTSGPASGTLTYNGDGSFTYTPDAGAEGPDSFTYTITDGDGDTATATVTLNIAPDSVPVTERADNTLVDEDGLPTANVDNGQVDPTEVDSTELATATGTIVVDFGKDVPVNPLAAIAFINVDALDGTLSSGGQGIDFSLVGGAIVGTIDGGATEVVRISIDSASGPVDGDITYSYSVTLSQPVDQLADGNIENSTILSGVQFQVTDSDGDTATGSVNVTIVDDVPTANADSGNVSAGGTTTFTGNVLANDVEGADGALVVSASDGTTSDSSFPLVLVGEYGTLTIVNAAGDYSYVLDTTNPDVIALGQTDTVLDSFTYTIRDGDGDTDTAAITITVAGDNEAPVVNALIANVSEEGLPMGNPDSDPASDDTNLTVATGTFTASDADNDTLSYTISAPVGTGYFAADGTPIVWVQVDPQTVEGRAGTADGTLVITATVNDAGQYAVTLSAPMLHNDANIESEFAIVFPVSVSDGIASVPTTLTVNVEDDSPVVTAGDPGTALLATDDTTLGIDASAAYAGYFTASFGGDGPEGPLAYTLGITAGDTGIYDTATGLEVQLKMVGDTVVGYVDDGGTELIVFTVTVDASGTVTLDQQRAVAHFDSDGLPSDAPETLAAANLVTLTATATDDDGDTDSATIEIGGDLSFADDQPSVSASITGEAAELAITDDDLDPASDTLQLSNIFAAAGVDYGNDGIADTGALAEVFGLQLLIAEGGDSGLTSGGETIYLYEIGGTIIASTSATEADIDIATNVVFTVATDASGEVTLTQYQPLDHAAGSDLLILPDGLIGATYEVTITDGDGDIASDTAQIDLGGNLAFNDDLPAIAATGAAPVAVLDESPLGEDEGGDFDPAGRNSVTIDLSASFTADFGADTPGDVTYALKLVGTDIASGLYALNNNDTETTIDGFGQGEQIVLNLVGGDIVGTASGVEYFRISVDADTGEVTFTQSTNIWHSATSSDDDAEALVLASGVLSLVATAEDFDADTATASVDLGTGTFQIEDDGPAIEAVTNSEFTDPGSETVALTASGAFAFDPGTDGYAGNSIATALGFTLTGSVGGVAINSSDIDQPVFIGMDGDDALYSFSFTYDADPNTAGMQEATNGGTLRVDTVSGDYTVTLTDDFRFTETVQFSTAINRTGYNLEGTPQQSEIVVSELATDDSIFVQFTGDQGTLVAGGDRNFTNGEIIDGTQTFVSISNEENGVAGDTIQTGEVLDFNLYSSDPGGTLGQPTTAFASGLTLTLDGVGASEDFIVILKLADPDDPGTIITTRAIIVGSEDIYRSGDIIPEGYSANLDNNDGFVIIEANDYLQAGEDLVIVGAQLLSSSSGLTGSGIDLNGATGDDGGSTTTSAFGTATNDNDVVKISDVGLIRNVVDTQSVSLTFAGTLTDGDGDSETASFTINPAAMMAGSMMATSTMASSSETLQSSALKSQARQAEIIGVAAAAGGIMLTSTTQSTSLDNSGGFGSLMQTGSLPAGETSNFAGEPTSMQSFGFETYRPMPMASLDMQPVQASSGPAEETQVAVQSTQDMANASRTVEDLAGSSEIVADVQAAGPSAPTDMSAQALDALLALATAQPEGAQGEGQATQDLTAVKLALEEVTGTQELTALVDHLVDSPAESPQLPAPSFDALAALLNGAIAGQHGGMALAIADASGGNEEAALMAAQG